MVSSFGCLLFPRVLVKGPERLKKEREENERKRNESSAFLGLCEFLWRMGLQTWFQPPNHSTNETELLNGFSESYPILSLILSHAQ